MQAGGAPLTRADLALLLAVILCAIGYVEGGILSRTLLGEPTEVATGAAGIAVVAAIAIAQHARVKS